MRNVVRGLADRSLLDSYETTIACFRSGFWHAVSAFPGLGEIRRRSYDEDLRSFVRSSPSLELARLAALRLGLSSLVRHESGRFSVDRVYHQLDRKTARRVSEKKIKACYSYEDGALHTFRAAKPLGKKCLYDLPIGYWRAARRILSEEAERRPEWIPSMPGLSDSAEKLARKDEELSLADEVFVASSFTRRTLEEAPFAVPKVHVIPYGADEMREPVERVGEGSGPLKVLFVGALTQRKGVADLLEAVALMKKHVQLSLVGMRPERECRVLDDALKNHRWRPSLSRSEILAEMRRSDVFVFPSLFEGFGLVITEALSQGLPVITTENTCGPDVMENGKQGFIVPIRDPQAISEKLELLHRDRGRLASMRESAARKSRSMRWGSYQQQIAQMVESCIAGSRATASRNGNP